MNQILLVLIIALLIIILISVLVSLDTRIIKQIQKEANKKGVGIITIREPEKLDGTNPFGNFDIWIGTSSKILGMSGERIINKIVLVKENDKEEKYWVKIKTTFFMLSDVKWRKIK